MVLALAAARHPGYGQLVASAREFQHHFQDLKTGSTLGPIERIVVSLALSAKG